MKQKIILSLFLLIANVAAFACPACEKQQPKILRGITHGAGPQSDWDYVIVWFMVAIVLVTLFFSVKFIIHPREENVNHIKRTVLN